MRIFQRFRCCIAEAWKGRRRMQWCRWKTVFCVVVAWGILIASIPFLLSAAVCQKTEERILSKEELIRLAEEEQFDFILVLGCKVYEDGTLSHMLEDRVSVGVSLYHAGVSNRILMSGDHQGDSYNEVDPMRQAAVDLVVPEASILTDPYGISTYDSVYRAISQFKGKRIVIVTQEYHLSRALYAAEKLGVEAYGVAADLRPYTKQFFREVREVLARCKDIYYSLIQPLPVWGA